MCDVVQVPKAETEKVVQALPLETSNPRLGIRISNRHPNRCLYDMDILGPEQRVEGLRELSVVVTNEEPNIDVFLICPQQDIPPLLLNPVGIGVIGAGTGKHPPAPQMNEHHQERSLLPKRRPDALAEEVAGDGAVEVRLQEGLPGRWSAAHGASVGVGQDSLVFEYSSHGTSAGREPEFEQFAQDSPGTLEVVVLRHPHDEFVNRGRDGAASSDLAGGFALGFVAQPPAIGLDIDEVDETINLMIHLLAQFEQPAPLFRGEDGVVAIREAASVGDGAGDLEPHIIGHVAGFGSGGVDRDRGQDAPEFFAQEFGQPGPEFLRRLRCGARQEVAGGRGTPGKDRNRHGLGHAQGDRRHVEAVAEAIGLLDFVILDGDAAGLKPFEVARHRADVGPQRFGQPLPPPRAGPLKQHDDPQQPVDDGEFLREWHPGVPRTAGSCGPDALPQGMITHPSARIELVSI